MITSIDVDIDDLIIHHDGLTDELEDLWLIAASIQKYIMAKSEEEYSRLWNLKFVKNK